MPEFVDGMTADFSTSTSVPDCFADYTDAFSPAIFYDLPYSLIGCGIPAVEMPGTEKDWKKLRV